MNKKTAPFQNCDAVVIDSKTGLPRGCNSNGKKFRVSVLVKGGEAISEESVKSNNMPGWFLVEQTFCSTHLKVIESGKVVKVRGIKASQQQLFPTKDTVKPKRAVPQAFCGICKVRHDLALVKVHYAERNRKNKK